ncbi:MAG: hypothetical protein AAFU53_19610, partial [Cyanobacteria bacterium J06632_3]
KQGWQSQHANGGRQKAHAEKETNRLRQRHAQLVSGLAFQQWCLEMYRCRIGLGATIIALALL